jgi:hypothetical protein
MSGQATLNGGGPVTREADVQAVRAAQLDAALLLATKAAGAVSAQEAKDFAQASMSLAQAVVVLDPSLDQQGIPIAHQVELEKTRQDGQAQLERVRQAAAKPTPKKRTIRRLKGDSGYELEG